ncbi:MAG: hypothetical protein WC269_05335 [Candidatus Gracilibacteria bacterium]|jgi:hypothetical protein
MPNTSVGKLLKEKKKAKENLSKKLFFSRKSPILALFLDNELSKDEEQKMKTFLDGVSSLDVIVVALADSNLETLRLPNVVILPYDRLNRKELLAASDMALCFPFSDVEEMIINGVIPISSVRPGIADYNPNCETGNSFIYKKEDPWHIFAALVRARETFKFPYDWAHIVRQGLCSICGRKSLN